MRPLRPHGANPVRYHRLRQGIALATLADAAGIATERLVSIDEGIAAPSSAERVRLASALSCHPDALDPGVHAGLLDLLAELGAADEATLRSLAKAAGRTSTEPRH